MSRRVAVFTGTRAEYGLLYWLMKDIAASQTLELMTIVAAMHLSPEFGSTWRNIERDGFHIDARVEMLMSSDSRVGVVKSMGVGLISLADVLTRLEPDMIVLLGDRFEAFAAAQAALVLGIPIAHLHGGEVTEGAYDEAFRHSITKMSALHFVAAEPYRRRVIQLGEDPQTVFNVGALGLDHLHRTPMVAREELSASLDFELGEKYLLCTYHSATAADEKPDAAIAALLAALDNFQEYQVVITHANADNGGRTINAAVDSWAAARVGRVKAVASLGSSRYLAVLRGASAIVGNSSSGIIEGPSFGVPTVDIGARQSGRLCADSIIRCAPEVETITVDFH